MTNRTRMLFDIGTKAVGVGLTVAVLGLYILIRSW